MISTSRMRLQASVACVASLVLWWRFGGVLSAALAGLFASLALLAWAAPSRYRPVQRGFDFLTRGLVSGFSWAMLGLVYFLVFTPLRLIGTLVGRDPLSSKRQSASDAGKSPASRLLRADADDATTFLRSMPPPTSGRFDRQF
ncbi:MAG: hypothetical protein IPP19_16645 [Verrucomicrobia bacterium]|nr:hypothetical protein [Verrucomicrobiota bacterium]